MDGTELFTTETECLVLGSIMSPVYLIDHLGPLVSNVLKQAKNLGVIFNSELKFDKHVNLVVKAGFFHVRCIVKKKKFLAF